MARNIRNFILMLIAIALCWAVPMIAFAQQGVTVVDMNGNVSTYTVRTYDLTPKTIPIKPYGLNLKPAKIPKRKRPPVTYNPAPYGGGPVTIENPYFVAAEIDHGVEEQLPPPVVGEHPLLNLILWFFSWFK